MQRRGFLFYVPAHPIYFSHFLPLEEVYRASDDPADLHDLW
jgi:hypothetical protein